MRIPIQEQKNITAACEKRVQKALAKDATGHDWHHIERVRRLAAHIAKAEGVDMFLVDLLALLHESADYKLIGKKTEGQALLETRNFLTKIGLEDTQAEEVIYVIGSQSFSKSGISGQKLDSLAGQCLQDADRLEAIGAIGIARCFMHAGVKGAPIHDPAIPPKTTLNSAEYKQHKNTAINHFYEKLLKLKDLMNTKEGKKLAGHRHKFMEEFLSEFLQEWSCEI